VNGPAELKGVNGVVELSGVNGTVELSGVNGTVELNGVNGPAELNGLTVLVVDDEPGMRDTLVAILEHHGYRVWSASDGETAFAAAQERVFDVVVMDIRMPGRDGVSVLQDMAAPPPQVILMTAYAMEERLRAAADAYVFAVLSKPFEVHRMLHLVARASRGDK
jgi:CheY-like chemotaxis protein